MTAAATAQLCYGCMRPTQFCACDGHVPDTARRPRDWRADAACRDHDPEWFFPMPKDTLGIERAKAVCLSGCPVRTECLDWAVESDDDWAVAGGTTPEERRATRQAVTTPTPAPAVPDGSAAPAVSTWAERRRLITSVRYHLDRGREHAWIAARLDLPVDTVQDLATPRRDKIAARRAHIRELHATGLTASEIADRVGIGIRPVRTALRAGQAVAS